MCSNAFNTTQKNVAAQENKKTNPLDSDRRDKYYKEEKRGNNYKVGTIKKKDRDLSIFKTSKYSFKKLIFWKQTLIIFFSSQKFYYRYIFRDIQ